VKLCVALLDLHIPGSHSLKEKRRSIQGLVANLRSRLNASVAEVDFQDKWQRAEIAVAWISADGVGAENYHSEIRKLVELRPEIEILNVQRVEY
jgi:uncharacterized protein